MSFISAIEGAEHTFAAWAEKELTKLVATEPEIDKIADTILQYAGAAASVIAGAEGGPAASATVTAGVSLIQTGVTALNGLITDFGATPTASSVATSIATNAQSLITAAQIKNPTSVKAATAIVTNLTTLATALTTASAATPVA